jgi:4-hydroxymandelate oxidase
MSLDGTTKRVARRRLLQYLAASPLLASGALPAFAESIMRAEDLPADKMWLQATGEVIASAKEAVNVFEFEAVARAKLPPAHWGFLTSGIGGEETLHANRAGYGHFHLRPRRLVDVSRPDTTTTLFGETYGSPIVVAPVGSQLVFHPQSETETARGAKAGDHLQILSTQTNSDPEAVIAARGRPLWFQLYASDSAELAAARVRRAEAAGFSVLVVTVDLVGQRRLERKDILRRSDKRNCGMCHGGATIEDKVRFLPLYRDFDLSGMTNPVDPAMTWESLKRLRDVTKMPIVIKGLMTPEDATLAVEYGFDGLIVSNHGGRADEAGLATIDALPDIVAAVGGRVPVLMDSGIRRGSDVVKALCLGATAVCVGRPYIWGLTAFGSQGVESVLKLLQAETLAMMQQVGAPTMSDLSPAMVARR